MSTRRIELSRLLDQMFAGPKFNPEKDLSPMEKEPLTHEEIQSFIRPPDGESPMKLCDLSVKSMHEAQSLVTLLASNGYLVTISEANLQRFWVKVWE